MADITMPKMGFDMTEGTIVRWLKQVGDDIKKGDIIAEIETDKVTVEIEAFEGGKLTQIVAGEGAVVPVGDPIAKLDGPAGGATAAAAPVGDTAAAATPQANAAAVQPAQNPIAVAEAGDAGTAQDEPSTTLAQTDGSAAATATSGGADAPRLGYNADDQEAAYAPGAPTQDISGAPEIATGEQIEPVDQSANGGPVFASPMAKRIAREQNVQLSAVKGTGPGGRIVRKDVEAFAQQAAAAPKAAPAPTPAAQPAAQPAPTPTPVAAPATAPAQPTAAQAAPASKPVAANTRREPLSRLRQTIARRLVQSKGPVPHFYVTSEIDMGLLMDLRKQLNTAAETKITVNDFIVKACAIVLKQFPVLNASFAEDALDYHDYINVSIAVATDNGLLAPAVTDVDKKSLGTISAEAKEMIERTRVGKATPDELGRGTFSVSNLGMYPADNFIAVINPPQSAIVAVGTVAETPVVRDGQIVIGRVMKATISVDHRVSDGAVAAEFMQALKRVLENPMLVLV